MNVQTPIADIARPDELRARARTIAETLPARLAEANRRRDIDPDVIAALREADLFRLLRPARFGGLEADPRLFWDVQNILAEQCLSTAWVFGVLSIQSFVLALFDPAAQEDVWGQDPDMLVSSSFKPDGTVTPVAGGFRISGQWGFSSGSSHAGWALIGGLVPAPADGGPPEMRLFLVPRSDYDIIDTWNSFGLRGTGSNDIRVDDAFVPAHRSWKPTAGVTTDPRKELSALFRLPWLFMFPSCISNLSIGAARGAIRKIAGLADTMQQPAANAARGAIAHASRDVEAANCLLQSNLGRMLDHARAGAVLPMDEALLYRSQMRPLPRSWRH